jgi:hypothetical protein
MIRAITHLSILALLCCSVSTVQLQAQRCGVERWAVKTGTDTDAMHINLANRKKTTIAELIALTPPSPIPFFQRFANTETSVFVVDAMLTDYKMERDSDYHLVLQDDRGNTMVAEIPSPDCVGSASPFATQIASARSKFDSQLEVSRFFQTVNIPVEVTGVGFFDFPHHQHGMAPNGIELHPVLDIVFMSMKQQAQTALRQPVKVDVVPLAQGKQPGDTVPVQVLLRDGNGEPVGAIEDTSIELDVTQPSGKVSSATIHLTPGERSKDVNLVIDEAGLSKLSVRHSQDRLLGSTNYLLISPQSSVPKKRKRIKKQGGTATGTHFLRRVYTPPGGGIILASLTAPIQNAGSSVANTTQPHSHPRLMLRVSGENDAEGIRADGKAFARVQVFHIPTMPQSDVKIWLRWTNGDITPNPLVLKKGIPVAEARWTSQDPITAARVSVAVTDPAFEFEGPQEATVRFGEPILGIDFVNPPDSMSIVDTVDLVARFFDSRGAPVETAVQRHYRFASNSPILRLIPEQDEVAPGKSEFSTIALPTSIGWCNIEVSTPGYKAVSHKIRITGTIALLLCVLGGVLGGTLAYINSQGKLWMRILSGTIVALVATWAYVYVGLPKTNTIILHNQLSVLFVAIVSALAGVKGLATITKALGFGF